VASLVATTADINGGTIDSAIIGGTTAAAITATTIEGTTITATTAVDAATLEVGDATSGTGEFVVDADGATTTSSLNAGSGAIQTTGTLSAGAATVTSLDAGDGLIKTTGNMQTAGLATTGSVTLGNGATVQGTFNVRNAADDADVVNVNGTTADVAIVGSLVATTADINGGTIDKGVLLTAGDDSTQTVTAMTAANAKASTALSAILTDYGTTNTVQTAGIADSAVTLSKVGSVVSNSLTRVEAKVDALALFTTSTGGAISESGIGDDIAVTALKAIDATNAKANTAALGDVETRVDVIEANGGNTFLGFIKRLFGGS
jgi:hypothetical protein